VADAPVEIEFAINLHREDALPASFGFLQMRPMMVSDHAVEVDTDELFADNVLLATQTVLGNGVRDDLTDVVFIPPEAWDASQTPAMAKELESIDRELAAEGRHYVLIGFGRWGTSDPPFGVPVAWGQISRARVIVEATLPEIAPDLSQGSHFFHNVLSFQVLYLSVEHDGPFEIDWQWLQRQQVAHSTAHCKHVRLDEPLTIKVDGASGRGVITYRD
jgi:hypothetical protein